jgi:hypothetical protein
LIGTNLVSTNLADRDQLAQLEAERDRLQSMIAYHERPFLPPGRAPAWFIASAAAIICALGVSMVVAVWAGQISSSDFLLLVVGLPLLTYILSRVAMKIKPTVGEFQTRQYLADCEARIMKLKEHP